ncbi:DEAD/DEAH box helicase [uncultured Tateyamaria sp.]|uniref:DEAD/DEAH box helicase n=1 Tax=uncultured Tateyamaria sp. TaxID=455651 RepID=UPI00261D03C4|nr:DEAD/DEAH box helicase [uncultured Tateyamaria sp.]
MFQALTDALTERGYENLTAVQTAVTDSDLTDRDLLVSAQTGSGKTVGFGLAVAPNILVEGEMLPSAEAPLALVVAPTRELALQVKRELSWLYSKAGAYLATCVGGMDMRDERRALDRGAHIVVGTPGRLRDHIQRGSLDMSNLRAIVLDEADEMLDLGFREDLEFMLGEAPENRRTLMFSATVPPMIAKLAKQFQRDAVRVTTLNDASQHADITYQALRVAQHDTENAIINVLRYQDAENAIVFANTRAMVNRLTARLTNRGFSVVALSGELSQTERSHALQAMRDGRAKVCVATDVAARGIDLPKLELVIHAELPSNAEGLLHRSGRTGRAGRKGISVLIVPAKSTGKAERLLRFAKIEADWTAPPSAEDIHQRDEERLLADPVWTADATPEQEAFAAKLLDLHSPEKIAVAYLALHRARLSAPEDLSAPSARPDRKEARERKPFGPSVWFALSVGRDERAEPRWLLPLICRAGNLDKDAIGAIRIQQSESFVEIQESSVQGFLASIGDGLVLEDGIKARKLDEAPDLSAMPRYSGPKHKEKSDGPPSKGPEGRGKSRKVWDQKPASKMSRAIDDGAVKPHRAPKSRDAEHSTGDAKPAKKAPTDKHKSRGPKGGAKGKPKPPSSNASDTSKRFKPGGKTGKPTRPSGGRPKSGSGPKRYKAGGNEPPKRR